VLPRTATADPTTSWSKQALWGVIGIGGMVAHCVSTPRAASARRRLRADRRLDAAADRRAVSEAGQRDPPLDPARALSFQPAEAGKLSIIVFLSYHSSGARARQRLRAAVPPCCSGLVGFLILIQPTSDAFCLVLTGAVMLFVRGPPAYFFVLAIPA